MILSFRLSRLLLFTLFLLYAGDASSGPQQIRFFREKIELSIEADHILLEGRYFFRNDGENVVEGPLFYPFPVDSSMLYPDSIHVFTVADNGALENIRYKKVEGGVMFGVNFPPADTREIRVTYRQQVKAQTARYILTTTRLWGRPLEEAEFFLTVPHNLEMQSVSYHEFELWEGRGKNVYHMKKMNFMPETDLIVNWSVNPNF